MNSARLGGGRGGVRGRSPPPARNIQPQLSSVTRGADSGAALWETRLSPSDASEWLKMMMMMMAPEPLRSAMTVGGTEDTSLALPSDNKLRTGQQRVLDQVHTIKRSRSRPGKSSPTTSTSHFLPVRGHTDTALLSLRVIPAGALHVSYCCCFPFSNMLGDGHSWTSDVSGVSDRSVRMKWLVLYYFYYLFSPTTSNYTSFLPSN